MKTANKNGNRLANLGKTEQHDRKLPFGTGDDPLESSWVNNGVDDEVWDMPDIS